MPWTAQRELARARALLPLLLLLGACADGPTLVLGDRDPPRYRFGAPRLLDELSVDAKTDNPSLTSDMLELYFTSERERIPADIFVARRSARGERFGPAQRVAELSASGVETGPAVSGDGRTLWFASDREGGLGGLDIWVATRELRDAAWSAPQNLGVLNSSANEIPRPLGLRARVMPMASDRTADPFHYQIAFAQRAGDDDAFESPAVVAELVTADESTLDAFLTDDGLALFYVRGPAFGPADLYVATRRATTHPFESPQPLGDLNSPDDERDPWLSPDGSELYFSSDRAGNYDIYVASVERIAAPNVSDAADAGGERDGPPSL